jgi:hypothetical protein
MINNFVDSKFAEPVLFKPAPVGQRNVRFRWFQKPGEGKVAKAATTTPAAEIVDEMETPLLDGSVMKTVTTVVVKDGVRMSKTRSYVVHSASHPKSGKRRLSRQPRSN